MNVERLSIPDVMLVTPPRFRDPRGFFSETWKQGAYEQAGISGPFVQDNHAVSTGQYVIRGLHTQIGPNAQGKLVRVVRGAVFDVAVDIRKGSPTFGQWVGALLTEDNHRQLWVPPGLAHGFLVLSESADFLYKTTDYYSPEHERCIRWDDPQLAIAWPSVEAAIQLSAKDQAGRWLAEADL